MNSSPPSVAGLDALQTSARVKRAAFVSLGISLTLLAVKFLTFHFTHSQAIFSDAMESIVNVVAACLAMVVVIVALKPADKDHPYGHGKVEFFSAAFEGGLIAFAAVVICVQAIETLLKGEAVESFGLGIAVTIAAGLGNAALGFYLVHMAKKTGSMALDASGRHVLSDFWTSIAVAVGLGLVEWTGLLWIDAVVALLVGLMLAKTGYGLVRRSIGGLLDEEDLTILDNLANALSEHRSSGIIQVHHVRVIRSGRFHHIDAHAVVPEFWDVAEAHAQIDAFEADLMRDYPSPGELHLHVDPCRRAYCKACDIEDCKIRQHPFERRLSLSLDELTNPEEPSQFRS